MNAAQIIDSLRKDPKVRENLTTWQVIPPRPARYAPFPEGISERLIEGFAKRGITQLYTHQAESISAAMRGENVCVVTPTASGKTLCYNIPVLHTLMGNPDARALYLFPTKALSQDQMNELKGTIDDLEVRIGTYTFDGDTPSSARKAVRNAGHIVVTNPDMLHTGILPHHTIWMKLFENLKFVVIDEVHHYRGVFGSHLANVVRRLTRICRFYGSDPQFSGIPRLRWVLRVPKLTDQGTAAETVRAALPKRRGSTVMREVPKPAPVSGDMDWFVDARFGMFIHWGTYAAAARHEWVKHLEQIPDADYQKYFDHFDPDLYDPREWARTAREAGMKYFVITTKHHEGFCLWDTQYTDYKATNTPCQPGLTHLIVLRSRFSRLGTISSLASVCFWLS